MSSRTPAASAPTASAKTTASVAAAASTAPRAETVAANETDTIIEELKALAQSMLDATNAARSRAQAPDKKRSYEALMSAIEGRGLRPYPGSSSSADGSSEANGSFDAEAGGGAPRAIRDRHGDPNNMTALSSRDIRQPRAGANGIGAVPAASTSADAPEVATDIPAALTPQYKLTATNERGSKDVSMTIEEDTAAAAAAGAGAGAGPRITSSSTSAEAATDRRDPHEGSLSDGAKAAAGVDAQESEEALATIMHTRQKGRAGSDARSGSAETGAEDEEDDNVYDGVRTQVLFKSTDARAYREVVASAWKPERLLRAADGTSEALNDDEDADGSGDEPTRDRDGEIDDDDVIVSVQRRAPQAAAQRTKVLRVPSFPFGGGITQDQFKALRTMFNKSIRSVEAAVAAAATSNSTVAPQQQPLLITKSAFESREYQEVKADILEREASFRPTSPYQFVVEVEQDVVFDAVRAREQRRKDFRRLAKEGRAPVTMGTFDLRIVMDPFKTGFEDEKNFPIVKGAIVADRYQIIQLLGKATFSRAVRCYDLHQPIYEDDEAVEEEDDGQATVDVANKQPVGYVEVCLKIINNTKDFFDQSLDEIRLLQLINKYKDADEAHVVRLIDAFYYKEHTMLVTELLSDNLYEFAKYNREEEDEFYFTLPRLRRIARQVTEALAYVHSLNLIHTDLKPENILFLSHRRCIVKVIDFGSSCFLSDHLSSYIQSRSYRAPEVILGADYDGRIDVWSLGAILVELVTGDVLFTCETVPEMLARMVSVCGLPFPRRLLWEGRHTSSFINKFGAIYESAQSNPHAQNRHDASAHDDDEPYYVYTPVPPSPAAKPYAVLREKLAAAGMNDSLFFSFVKDCLCLDHKARKTSAELLSHPFIVNEKV